MPSKNTKKQRRTASKVPVAPDHQDDGSRWYVMSGMRYPHRKMYGGKAYDKNEAHRLAEGLLYSGYCIEANDA